MRMNPRTKLVLLLIIKAVKIVADESMPYWRAQKVHEILDEAQSKISEEEGSNENSNMDNSSM